MVDGDEGLVPDPDGTAAGGVERKPGGPDDYVRLATLVINTFIESREDMEDWWRGEKDNRKKYGVTPEHEMKLAQVCKDRLAAVRLQQRKKPKSPYKKKRLI